ncbi:hypothetical protein LTR91_021833 [Friedmanniomyces endolithicus]|uniref:Uncharacterized protein n=1 Tax=Friedmanniomyces endolithicus TaxID=329885 RepID=A0AAN6JZY6_9PEZI|nr:hypothetical protein LTR03_008997 [Friedmanniomyces endolithicus]KAK0860048.1 hypothetical protein LTR87_017431 [Friedmanniomyces endolithicus]KAK0890055.1 hypothetical protein LTR02_014988 [Friedmanniomyces endolithicus]KAK0904683.1 hypothetical protein LTR57_018653 [Friedmanniomyces endolithicus]KAK0957520.1 hypothetical protein LTR91_021833 [Friedmanniomyces endolithicus]
MSTPNTTPLSQAERTRKAASTNSTTSRTALAYAQTRKTLAYTQLQALRKQHRGLQWQPKHGKQWHSLLCRRLEADVVAAQLAGDVREAFELVAIREKEVKQVRSDEAEIRRDHDACLFAQGKLQLQHGGPATTGSTGPLQEWRDRVEEAFTDYPSITPTNFPAPPPLRLGGSHTLSCPDREPSRPTHAQVCTNPRKHACASSSRDGKGKERPIEACECAVRAAFRGEISLRSERLRWSPERFPKEVRREARYVFEIVEGMCEVARQG